MIAKCTRFALGASLLALGLSLAAVDVQFAFQEALAAKGGHGGGKSGRGKGDEVGDDNQPETAVIESDTQGDMASTLGSLNASRASQEDLAHAAPGSVVGEIAVYKTAMGDYLKDQIYLQSLLAAEASCTRARPPRLQRSNICCRRSLPCRLPPT
jgi:hypothetical protein